MEIASLVSECLKCAKPSCILGCPASNNIKEFITLCQENKIQEAYDIVKQTSTLASICSLVCPFENNCVGHCIKNKINKPVKIPLIENYIATHGFDKIPNNLLSKKEKIAIVGSGPAGLACSEILATHGYQVDIYDEYFIPGGILTYGIPSFVLPKEIVKQKIAYLKKLKINFIMNKKLGKDITISSLESKYDAIFLAIGASINKKLNVNNENLENIIDASYFLKKMSEGKFDEFKDFKDIIVIGGGNTAIDVALSAKKYLDSNVSIVYRRSLKEMPARKDDITKAINDNIAIKYLVSPINFLGDHKVIGLECLENKLVEDGNNRAKPIAIENSNFFIKADLVIKAISYEVDKEVLEDLKTTYNNQIVVNEHLQTSKSKVFAGGDVVLGPTYVVTAMTQGMKAAQNIINFLEKDF